MFADVADTSARSEAGLLKMSPHIGSVHFERLRGKARNGAPT
jgi:hypothetical protein